MAESGQRFYNDEDAEQILRLASSICSPSGSMNRERLLETAAELGIPAEAVEMAESQYLTEKTERNLQKEFDVCERREFRTHLTVYCIVNLFLVAINLVTDMHEFWAIYPILGWGLGVTCHAASVFNKDGSSYRSSYERFRARRMGNELDHSESELDGRLMTEPSVQIGVHLRAGNRRRIRDDRRRMREEKWRDR